MSDNDLMLIDESSLKNKIYFIRGQQVMLDFDLAQIYGFSVSAFNQQIKRNADRFDDDFMFELNKSEMEVLSKSQNVISIQTQGIRGGRSKPVKAFNEQGLYMLMTILRGELAVQQSKTLIRLFKAMKDSFVVNQSFLTQYYYSTLVNRVESNTKAIDDIRNSMVSKTELSDFMKLFSQGLNNEELLILDGQPFKADEAYQEIYRSAKNKILVIDDYISTKTLHHLAHSRKNVKITIVSDNLAKPKLTLSEYNDFLTENSGKAITFLHSLHRSHDRYIVLDEGTKDMKIYHCGASSKDAGNRVTTITRINDIDSYKVMISAFSNNPVYSLR